MKRSGGGAGDTVVKCDAIMCHGRGNADIFGQVRRPASFGHKRLKVGGGRELLKRITKDNIGAKNLVYTLPTYCFENVWFVLVFGC